ncbi:hypothetical protein [Acinetobacter sp. D009]|uniref:hypothetical protein n=1 Tax=Acinetobacter sp. D009 TaxID=3138069 RepID=UPI0031451A68
MNEYFKTYTESHDGIEGTFYCEVEKGLIIRHISVFEGIFYWATPKEYFHEQYDFTDQPEFGEADESAISISKAEFDVTWNHAVRQNLI